VTFTTADDLDHEIARSLARDGRFELARGLVLVDDYARCDRAVAAVLAGASTRARASLVVAGPAVRALRPILARHGLRARLATLEPLSPRARARLVDGALERIERREGREPGSLGRVPRGAHLPPSGFELEGIACRMALEAHLRLGIELPPRV
jgi:hypothetical protein